MSKPAGTLGLLLVHQQKPQQSPSGHHLQLLLVQEEVAPMRLARWRRQSSASWATSLDHLLFLGLVFYLPLSYFPVCIQQYHTIKTLMDGLFRGALEDESQQAEAAGKD